MKVERQAIIRGKILYYLGLIYPQAATLLLLQGELDFFGCPVPLEDLNSHVAYLDEKSFVAVEEIRRPGMYGTSVLVKLTARGIDYIDGRLPQDDGIYLEPGK